MKQKSFLFIALAAFMCISYQVADAALTANNQYHLTINRGESGGILASGHSVFVGAYVSSSLPITSVTARQVVGGTNSGPLSFVPSPLFPNEYSYRWNYNSSYVGQWQITATDGSETITVNTHVLDDPMILPLAQTLSVSTDSGQMTPTLFWTGFEPYSGFSGTPYAGADDFNVRVRARLASNGRPTWDSPSMSTSLTSYTLPAGALEPGTSYLLEIMLNHYDYEDGLGWQLENRSETYLLYTAPGALGLTISNPGAYTINRGGDASAATYTMEVEAIVTDTGDNQITSVWAYNGSYNYQLTPRNFGSIGTLYYHEGTYAGQTGIWEIQATNSLGQTTSAYTHILDKPLQIPLVTGVSFSDQTTSPTVYWNLVPSSAVDNYRVRVTSDGYYTLYQSNLLPSTATSFQIPAGIMSFGTQYIVRIQAYDFDMENGVSYVENRSDYHTYFTPTSVTPISGDFNGDCDVDGNDLAALLANPSWLDVPSFAQNFGRDACQ
jgi:hypothetical protein